MKTCITLRAMALAGVCLVPLAAAAQSTGEQAADTPDYNNDVTMGFRWQSQSSPIYGRYNGATEKGFTSLGGFNLQGRDSNDLGKNFYYQAMGNDLDFNDKEIAPDGSLSVKFGNQGTWGVGLGYDSISHAGQTFYSPWYSNGGLSSKFLQFGGATASTTKTTGLTTMATMNANLPALQKSLIEETAGTRREIVKADGKYRIGGWTFSTNIQNEHKEGTLLQTMMIYNHQSVAFPEPVNYDTQRYTAKGTFTSNRLQAVVSYDYSKFTDNASFNAPYFYANSASPYMLTATYGLPPSNDSHLVNGSVGYDLTDTTRIDGAFHYGFEMQDDSVNPGNGTTAWQSGKNPQSSDLMARVYGGNVSLNASPLSHLDLSASYNLDGRADNDNPTRLYGANGGDGASSTTGALSSYQQSWTNQTASLEAGYRIIPGTKVSVGYTYKSVNRSYQDVSGAKTDWYSRSGENTVSAKLASRLFTNMNGSVAYEHSIRAANAAQYTSGGNGLWYEAPMVADTVKLRTSYTPVNALSLGLNGKFATHHYNYPVKMWGLERDSNGSIGPDVTYMPAKNISTHMFYTYQRIYYGNQLGGSAAALNNYYGESSTSTNDVHTAGLSGDWKITDRLKVGADYTFTYGNISYNVFDGVVVSSATAAYQNIQNVPDVSSSMHSAKFKAEYELAPNLTLMGGYQFDLLSTNDWAYSYSSTLLSGSLLSGETSPSYRVHTIYTAVRMKF